MSGGSAVWMVNTAVRVAVEDLRGDLPFHIQHRWRRRSSAGSLCSSLVSASSWRPSSRSACFGYAAQTGLGHTEVLRQLGSRHITPEGQLDGTATEHGRIASPAPHALHSE